MFYVALTRLCGVLAACLVHWNCRHPVSLHASRFFYSSLLSCRFIFSHDIADLFFFTVLLAYTLALMLVHSGLGDPTKWADPLVRSSVSITQVDNPFSLFRALVLLKWMKCSLSHTTLRNESKIGITIEHFFESMQIRGTLVSMKSQGTAYLCKLEGGPDGTECSGRWGRVIPEGVHNDQDSSVHDFLLATKLAEAVRRIKCCKQWLPTKLDPGIYGLWVAKTRIWNGRLLLLISLFSNHSHCVSF